MADAVYNMKGTGYLACLLGLCVLFYYGTIRDVKSRHPSLLDEDVGVALVAQSRSVGRVNSAVELPVKDDTSRPDYADSNPAGVHRTSGQTQLGIEESLDPDVDPGMFYADRSSQQKNSGAFLDIDGEPGNLNSSEVLPVQNTGMFLEIDDEPNEQSSFDIPAPQNVGPFLDADGDGIDSYFDAANEPIVVNTGKYLDLNGLE